MKTQGEFIASKLDPSREHPKKFKSNCPTLVEISKMDYEDEETYKRPKIKISPKKVPE